MNRFGVFAKTFLRPSIKEVLDAVIAHGFDCVQFNMACAGLPALPESVPDEVVQTILDSKLYVAATSGTFNIIDADLARCERNLERLGVLASFCAAAGCPIITLCSGTRDPVDMWREHPENGSPEAWSDMIGALEAALRVTEAFDITLGIEPEPANVIGDAGRARRMLDEMQSPRLKIVMDGANILEPLPQAFDLLGPDIVLVHAKEPVDRKMDWPHYFALIRECGYHGPIILHGFPESDVADALRRMRSQNIFQRN
jgi:sugar phosphate isomerase/epimerase